MASRPRFLVAVAGGLLLTASLTACAHAPGESGTASPHSQPPTTTAPAPEPALTVEAPTPTRPEPKALSPLPTVPAR